MSVLQHGDSRQQALEASFRHARDAEQELDSGYQTTAAAHALLAIWSLLVAVLGTGDAAAD